MKKFKVWGTTRVHVVRIVEAETAEAALEDFDGAVQVVQDDHDGRDRVKACDEGTHEITIDDEYELCEVDEVVEVTP